MKCFFLLMVLYGAVMSEWPTDLTKKELEDILHILVTKESGKEAIDKLECSYSDDRCVESWLKGVNIELQTWFARNALAEWNFATDVTDENMHKVSKTATEYSTWFRDVVKMAKKFNSDRLGENVKRQLYLLTLYANPYSAEKVRVLSETQGKMTNIYNTAKVRRKNGEVLQLEPGLQNIMSNSRDASELLWAWKEWRDVTGPYIKPLYTQYVKQRNEGAVENGYENYAEFWKEDQFHMKDGLEEMCDQLWEQLMPMYQHLHAYVRRKLIHQYGSHMIGTDGTIPAHLLGNMWAQDWKNIYSITALKTHTSKSDNEQKRLQEQYNVHGLFEAAEKFYKSINMYPMTQKFWKFSMFKRPKQREVQCHASAFDLYVKDDYRIKMCTEVTMGYFNTIHHEMGHVEYFMAYSNQPTIYRSGANQAFHEAVGDTVQLSVLSRKHLEIIGLVDKGKTNAESDLDDIDALLKVALYKMSFLPFGYLIDKWRWGVMSGKIREDEYNRRFWEMRLKYQGIVAPIPRSEDDFDPGAKFHIPSNSPYMCYFLSYVLQFQFYKALCDESGHTGPLHQCDFYNSKAAGNKFKRMLAKGSSVPWRESLKALTGKSEISTAPILEYFKPLFKWLEKENKVHGGDLGWKNAKINWKK